MTERRTGDEPGARILDVVAAAGRDLEPADQHAVRPSTLHWFRGGWKGAAVADFARSCALEHDMFGDLWTRRIR